MADNYKIRLIGELDAETTTSDIKKQLEDRKRRTTGVARLVESLNKNRENLTFHEICVIIKQKGVFI